MNLKCTDTGVWVFNDGGKWRSVSKEIAESALYSLGISTTEWRLRDKVVCRICDKINGALSEAYDLGKVGGELMTIKQEYKLSKHELPTAAAARAHIMNLETGRLQDLKTRITKNILAEIEKGKASAHLGGMSTDEQPLIAEWLQSKGYKVEYGDDQRDGCWFKVQW